MQGCFWFCKEAALEAKEHYNRMHSYFRARIEQLFSRFWPFGIVQNVWRGRSIDGAFELQRRMHVFMHFMNFALKRRLCYEPPGVWPVLPVGVDSTRAVLYHNPDANHVFTHQKCRTVCENMIFRPV